MKIYLSGTRFCERSGFIKVLDRTPVTGALEQISSENAKVLSIRRLKAIISEFKRTLILIIKSVPSVGASNKNFKAFTLPKYFQTHTKNGAAALSTEKFPTICRPKGQHCCQEWRPNRTIKVRRASWLLDRYSVYIQLVSRETLHFFQLEEGHSSTLKAKTGVCVMKFRQVQLSPSGDTLYRSIWSSGRLLSEGQKALSHILCFSDRLRWCN